MKKFLFTFASLLMLLNPSWAATEYKAVFELTSEDEKTWEGILKNVSNTKEALKDVQIEVVAHSSGINFMTEKNKNLQKKMKDLAEKNVTFYACQNTLEGKNISKKELLPFVQITDSGVGEVIRKQAEGWSYVKIGK
jgi:uncharacterized protein